VRRLLADGFCRGAILVMTLDLSTQLSQRFGGMQDPLLSWPSICALGVILAAALIGAERLAGVAALVWTADDRRPVRVQVEGQAQTDR
jgi:hypothetical protein